MRSKVCATLLAATLLIPAFRCHATNATPEAVAPEGNNVEICIEKEFEWEFWWEAGADLASNYLWRGYDQTYDGKMFTPSIQPSASIGYGMFYLELWGSFAFNGSYHELDVALGFEYEDLTITLYDVYSNFSAPYFGSYEESGHSLTATIDYLLFDRLNLHWATTLAGGYDYTAEGKRAYSSYFEIGYTQPVKDMFDIEIHAGASPYTAPYWCTGPDFDFDNPAKGFNVTRLSLTLSREFETDWATFPVSVGYTYNPTTERHYALIMAGVSF